MRPVLEETAAVSQTKSTNTPTGGRTAPTAERSRNHGHVVGPSARRISPSNPALSSCSTARREKRDAESGLRGLLDRAVGAERQATGASPCSARYSSTMARVPDPLSRSEPGTVGQRLDRTSGSPASGSSGVVIATISLSRKGVPTRPPSPGGRPPMATSARWSRTRRRRARGCRRERDRTRDAGRRTPRAAGRRTRRRW